MLDITKIWFSFFSICTISSNSKSVLKRESPLILKLNSSRKSWPTTLVSSAFKLSPSSPLVHSCFYSCDTKATCFHSFSFGFLLSSLYTMQVLRLTNSCQFQIPVTRNQMEAQDRLWERASPQQRSWLTCNRCRWLSVWRRCGWELALVVWEWPRAAGRAERWWLELVTALLLVSPLEGW